MLRFFRQQQFLKSTGKGVTMAAAAAAGGALLLYADSRLTKRWDEEDFDFKQSELKIPSIRVVRSGFPFEPAVVECDAMLLPSPETSFAPLPPRPGRSFIRKHSTTELLEATAEDDTLESKYRVMWDVPLGQGTYGDVFVAKHLETGEKYALKKIAKCYTDDETFQREMDALLLVKEHGGHPNICGIREHFEEGNFFYIVLDLIKGGEMFEQLCNCGPYSEADAARLMREVTSALAYLHGIGVVHSDLKPENLMLSSKDTDQAAIKVVDFGCAHSTDVVLHDHEHRGTAATAAYCPPEILATMKEFHNKHATIAPSFDMWSIGVIAYVMLVGQHPFDLQCSNTDEEIETLILSGEKPPLRNSEHTKHLSDEAIDLLDRLLEWDPEKRLTADALLKHSWIQGKNASSKKMAHSDKRLSAYRKHEAKVMRNFFLNMLTHSDTTTKDGDSVSKRTSLLETAFMNLDPKNRGYISTKELHGSTSYFEADAKLSLSEVTDLLSEHMKNQYFPNDRIIYEEGSKGDKMYFINSGTIEVTSKDGSYYKKRQAGEFCGEDALLSNDHTRIHSVRCLTPVHAIEIDRADFNKYLAGDADVQLHMAETDLLRNRENTKTILGLQKNMLRKIYKKGEIPFRAGDKGNVLYILEEGTANMLVKGHKVRSLKPGEMTGEHAAFFNSKPYNVTLECVSDRCKMQTIKDIHEVFKKNASLQESFRHIILFRDFKKALVATIERPFPETEKELRAAFDVIDTNKSGSVGLEKLRDMVKQFDAHYTEADMQDMMSTLDLSNTGCLTWAAFQRMFGNGKDM